MGKLMTEIELNEQIERLLSEGVVLPPQRNNEGEDTAEKCVSARTIRKKGNKQGRYASYRFLLKKDV